MHKAVADGFYDWSARYEGAVNFPYLDVKGLVSIGVGILADPVGLMLSLPLRRKDGTLASTGEITAEYNRIKSLGDKGARLGHLYARQYATLHLDDAGMHLVVERKLDTFETVLKRRYPNWEEYPADAQLGVMSYAWAMGPSFEKLAPKFDRAVKTMQWLDAAVESHLQEKGNPGVIPRNKAMDELFRNASVVDAQHLDPTQLYWPRVLDQEPPEAA
jgi:hypothetical protein